MKIRKAGGFTLIELLIAAVLSIAVLLGIISLSSSILRYQYEGVRKGKVSGQTLFALSRMQKEIEEATHLELPSYSSTTGNVLSACANWSMALSPPGGASVDSTLAVSSFYYCVDSSNSLLRYSGTTCPYTAPASCGSGTFETVVYQNFYLMDNYSYYFARASDVGGVEMHYIVGNSTPTANVPNPAAYKINTKIGMRKNYLNTYD
ncbi:MAG: hypothetical protein HY921_01100 [Elusimicrobia bacterium]|nr:hypothetical protein [Elusimicrobiota bacterium]